MSTPTAPRPLSLADQLAAGGVEVDPSTPRAAFKADKAPRERRRLGRRKPVAGPAIPDAQRDLNASNPDELVDDLVAGTDAPPVTEMVEAVVDDVIEVVATDAVIEEQPVAGDAVALPALEERFEQTAVIDTAAIDTRDTLATQRDLRAALAAQMERDRLAQAARDDELARARARAEQAARDAAARRETAEAAARASARHTWEAASRDLTAAVQEAQTVLASAPEGIDPAQREAVAAALADADRLREPADDVDELTAACTRVLASRAQVSSTTAALARAVALWERTEDQRRAAEREQAARLEERERAERERAEREAAGADVVENPTGRDAQTRVLPAFVDPLSAVPYTAPAVSDQQGAEDSTPRTDAAPARRSAVPLWRRRRVLVALVLVVLLGVSGAVGWRAYASHAVTSAHAQWVEERMTLTEQIQAAERVLEDADGKVADDAVRTQLSEAIAAAVEARRAPQGEVDDASSAEWQEATRDVIAAAAVLDVAMRSVTEAQRAWELQEAAAAWKGAQDALGAAVDDANAALAASAGQVSDDAVRQALQSAIDAATETRDQAVDDQEAAELAAAAEAMADATAALSGPVQSVREAQAAWVAEQERAAAAEAAAAAAAATADRAAARSGAQTPAQQPAAGAPAAAPATSSDGAARELWIRPGSVGCTSAAPNDFSVSASTGGITGPVVVTIGGRSLQIGTGSGSFSGKFEGLPAGTYSWSVSADGLVVPGSKSVVVPCPQS